MRKLRRVSSAIKFMGCLSLALPAFFIVLGMLALVLWSASQTAHEATCQSNIKQVQLSVLQYTEDWDETLPPAAQWATLSESAVKSGMSPSVWRCPGAESRYGYAFNRAVGGLPLRGMDEVANTISLFECDAVDKNTAGGPQDCTHEKRHREGLLIYAFLDGHIKFMTSQYTYPARWKPLLVSELPEQTRGQSK